MYINKTKTVFKPNKGKIFKWSLLNNIKQELLVSKILKRIYEVKYIYITNIFTSSQTYLLLYILPNNYIYCSPSIDLMFIFCTLATFHLNFMPIHIIILLLKVEKLLTLNLFIMK